MHNSTWVALLSVTKRQYLNGAVERFGTYRSRKDQSALTGLTSSGSISTSISQPIETRFWPNKIQRFPATPPWLSEFCSVVVYDPNVLRAFACKRQTQAWVPHEEKGLNQLEQSVTRDSLLGYRNTGRGGNTMNVISPRRLHRSRGWAQGVDC